LLARRCERSLAMFLILLTAVVTILLFVYLLAALLRPEWF
jgi:K+-transporting ATPase KdpF subunit